METTLILIGLLLGFLLAYLFFLAQQRRYRTESDTTSMKLVQEHHLRVSELQEKHLKEVEAARKQSAAQSRYTVKGKIAEQMAPLLSGFKYEPADARFLGSPVDYVVFKGYNLIRDKGEGWGNLEVVILDIKQGGANLSPTQQAIEEAVIQGRVSFEVVYVADDGSVRSQDWRLGDR